MSIFSDNIAQLIDRAGSQTALAEEIGVNQGTVSKWKTGTYPRDMKAVGKAAEYVGVSLDDLLNRPLAKSAVKSEALQPLHILLPVSLPDHGRLCRMMQALLKSAGLPEAADTHAEALARRLPEALARAVSDIDLPQSDHAANSPAPHAHDVSLHSARHQ